MKNNSGEMIKWKKQQVKFLMDFAQIMVRIYKKNPSEARKAILLDTYDLLKKTKIYEQEPTRLEEIDL